MISRTPFRDGCWTKIIYDLSTSFPSFLCPFQLFLFLFTWTSRLRCQSESLISLKHNKHVWKMTKNVLFSQIRFDSLPPSSGRVNHLFGTSFEEKKMRIHRFNTFTSTTNTCVDKLPNIRQCYTNVINDGVIFYLNQVPSFEKWLPRLDRKFDSWPILAKEVET